MKSGIFRKIFIIYGLVFGAAFLFVELYITRVVKEDYIRNLEDGLLVQAALVSDNLEFSGALDPDARAFKEKTGARVTIIGPKGVVSGDSDAPSLGLDNHIDRPEVQQAIIYGKGRSVRRSGTLNENMLYAALKVESEGGTAGFVRLAMPLSGVDEKVNSIRLKILTAVGAVLLAAGAVAFLLTARIRADVREINEFSDSLARGDLESRLVIEGGGEFGDIARNLGSVSMELRGIIKAKDEEYERLNGILRSIPDALMILDRKDTVVMASAASGAFFETGGVTGRTIRDIVRNPVFYDMMDRAKTAGETVRGEFELPYPAERHVSVNLSPISYKEGEQTGLIAVFHDITGMKKLEQVRKDFVANVSHEIKTPVASIKGFADTLLDGALDDRENARRFLGIIKSNSDRINSLVEDLMTISKIELGAMKVEKAEVDIDEVFEAVSANMTARAAAKGLYLKKKIGEGAARIIADRNRLIQIFTNLLDNAVKYTEKGGVTMGAEESEGTIMLYVEDTGIGVPANHIARLGERFYRVDPSRSRELGGTGLGLAIVKHLVRAHGWEMRIESAEGRGTKAIISAS